MSTAEYVAQYVKTTPGRVAAGVTGWSLLAAGFLAFAGPGTLGTGLRALVVLSLVVGFLFAIGLSIARFPGAAVALTIGLPLVGGFYVAGLDFIFGASTATRVLLIIVGAGPLWLALSGHRFVAPATRPLMEPTRQMVGGR